jgi:hypothetical protein
MDFFFLSLETGKRISVFSLRLRQQDSCKTLSLPCPENKDAHTFPSTANTALL